MILQQTEREVRPSELLQGLRAHLQALSGDARRYDSLLALIGDARFALLGEASHGTREFYRERAEITKRLILEKGFTAVAVEADWPDASLHEAEWTHDAPDEAPFNLQVFGRGNRVLVRI